MYSASEWAGSRIVVVLKSAAMDDRHFYVVVIFGSSNPLAFIPRLACNQVAQYSLPGLTRVLLHDGLECRQVGPTVVRLQKKHNAARIAKNST